MAREATVADARASGADVVVVTIGEDLVDGLLVVSDVAPSDSDALVSTVMDPAPPTVRPSLATRDLVDQVRNDASRPYTVVTKAAGALVGVVARDELLALARTDRLP